MSLGFFSGFVQREHERECQRASSGLGLSHGSWECPCRGLCPDSGLCPDPSLLLRLPYNEFFGGVSGLTVEQFQKINGFPNAFWGWGGEDDDLWNRYGLRGPRGGL